MIAVFELLNERPELDPTDVSPAVVVRGEAVPDFYEGLIQEGTVTEKQIQRGGDQYV